MSDAMRPEKRALLRELRRRQHDEWAHMLTPDQRLGAAEELHALAVAWGTLRVADDPAELWLTLKARWRRLAP